MKNRCAKMTSLFHEWMDMYPHDVDTKDKRAPRLAVQSLRLPRGSGNMQDEYFAPGAGIESSVEIYSKAVITMTGLSS